MTLTSKTVPVLLDATPIPANRGGVGRYVDEIIPALVRSGADLTIVCQPRDVDEFAATGARVLAAPAFTSSTLGRMLWEQLSLPHLARRTRARVVHSVHYTFPLFARVAHAVTIHDLTFFTHPELHTRMKGLFFRAWIRLCRRLHVTAITPSAATASEYTRITGASPHSVIVAHLGIDSSLFHPPARAAIDAFRARIDLPDTGWVAFLGTLEPRKNVTALVDGYVAALATLARPDRPPLLIAGGAGWDDRVGPAIARALDRGADVRLLGYLPLEELNAFLGGADVVAYPSLGEGFGLPVLEAMASGACVLTTRELSLPEVGGDAVAYTGTSSSEIAVELASLLDSPERRRDLASRASARAAQFTWDASAAAHNAAYDKAVS